MKSTSRMVRYALAALAGFLAAACLHPHASASPATLRGELARFAVSPDAAGLTFCALFAPAAAAGDTAEGTVIWGPDTPLIPASLSKLGTTARALERLGRSYTFNTRILADGPVQDGTLSGNLFVAGGGDPFLVSERLWLLADQLSKTGLRRVTGDLILDGSAFAPAAEDPARARDREISDRPYAARLSALAVNFNAAAFRLAPGPEVGAAAAVESDPLPCPWIRIENHLTTGPRSSQEAWSIDLASGPSSEIASFEGSLPAGTEPQTIYRAVADPERFSGSLLRAFLEAAGIAIQGKTTAGSAPAAARLLLTFPSLPLAELLASTNRFSNNFMADLIAMGLADSTSSANLTRGAAEITDWLHRVLGAGREVRVLDGSGLSPSSRVTGRVLLHLLQWAWQDLRFQPDFVASLAVPGEDGTLRRRFREAPSLVVRAKTGTMSDPMASGIAGYLQDPRGGPVAFVILMNGSGGAGEGANGRIPRLQAVQEKWVQEYLR